MFPFYSPPSLRYNITHTYNLDFYLGIPHLSKKIISNFMLLERPLSLKLIFHYYNQFKSLFFSFFFLQTQINRQRDRIIWMSDVLTIFFSLFHFTVFVAGVFLFLVFFFFLFFFQHVALSSSVLFFFFLYASVCPGLFFFFSSYFLGALSFLWSSAWKPSP